MGIFSVVAVCLFQILQQMRKMIKLNCNLQFSSKMYVHVRIRTKLMIQECSTKYSCARNYHCLYRYHS